jgi:transcriptional regulator with XRE-family HTH domain
VPKPKFDQAEEFFRKLLKDLRQEKGLTQAQLAQRLGFPQSYVSKYETGERRLDFVETVFVCNALGIGIDDFAKAFAAVMSKAGRKKRG